MRNFKKSGSRRDFAENRDRDFSRERSGERKIMHSAVCDECGNSCQVPFKPRGDKPVYCSVCFGGQSDSGHNEKRSFSKPRKFRTERPSPAPDNSKLINKIDDLVNKLSELIKALALKEEDPQEVPEKKEVKVKKAPKKKAVAKKVAKAKK